MLKGTKLSFRYHPHDEWIFQNLYINISPGQIVGLAGSSGYGKTTLAKILSGFLPPFSGNVTVDGNPLSFKGFCPVQLVFQHPELAVNPKWRIQKILQEGNVPVSTVYDDLGLNPQFSYRFPHELSGGELQRIVIARALNPQTRYLIADEISAMLDAISQARIWNMITDCVKKRNIGVLAISHESALLDRICDVVFNITDLDGSEKF